MKKFAIFNESGALASVVNGFEHNLPLNVDKNNVVELVEDLPACPISLGRWEFRKEPWEWFNSETPEEAFALALAKVRAERDKLLLTSDWTQLPDVPLATKEAWATYRQALRDVTLQPDPFNIVWPVAPA